MLLPFFFIASTIRIGPITFFDYILHLSVIPYASLLIHIALNCHSMTFYHSLCLSAALHVSMPLFSSIFAWIFAVPSHSTPLHHFLRRYTTSCRSLSISISLYAFLFLTALFISLKPLFIPLCCPLLLSVVLYASLSRSTSLCYSLRHSLLISLCRSLAILCLSVTLLWRSLSLSVDLHSSLALSTPLYHSLCTSICHSLCKCVPLYVSLPILTPLCHCLRLTSRHFRQAHDIEKVRPRGCKI